MGKLPHTPPLVPAPCTPREPHVDMEATASDLISDKPAGGEIPEEMLRQLLTQDTEWGRHEDHSTLFLIAITSCPSPRAAPRRF